MRSDRVEVLFRQVAGRYSDRTGKLSLLFSADDVHPAERSAVGDYVAGSVYFTVIDDPCSSELLQARRSRRPAPI